MITISFFNRRVVKPSHEIPKSCTPASTTIWRWFITDCFLCCIYGKPVPVTNRQKSYVLVSRYLKFDYDFSQKKHGRPGPPGDWPSKYFFTKRIWTLKTQAPCIRFHVIPWMKHLRRILQYSSYGVNCLQLQTARAISAHAQCACLLSLQMGVYKLD
jgi:hypothetical protein